MVAILNQSTSVSVLLPHFYQPFILSTILVFSCCHFIGYFLNFTFTNITPIEAVSEHMQLAMSLSCNVSSSLPRLMLKV